jgi:hypothetical protein
MKLLQGEIAVDETALHDDRVDDVEHAVRLCDFYYIGKENKLWFKCIECGVWDRCEWSGQDNASNCMCVIQVLILNFRDYCLIKNTFLWDQ